MRKNQHIAVVCNYELKPSRIGGMDRFFRAYNDRLESEGHHISWFFAGGEKFDFYSGFKLEIAQDIPVEKLVLRYLNKGEPIDVLVTHFTEICTPFYRQYKKAGGGAVLVVDHNPRPLGGFPLKKRLRNKAKGLFFSRYIDLFIGVSQYTKNCLLHDYGPHLKSKTRVIYNGIDTSIFSIREEPNFARFLVASHLRESKGIQDLIEAVHFLPPELQSLLKIDVYGEGPFEKELKHRIKECDLQQQFSFLGSTSKLPHLYQNYSYLLQPTYMECFSLSILESLASNVPVVTTPVGGNLEIIEDGRNGFIFQTGNVKELKDLLEKILRKEISIDHNVNRQIEENFSLQKMVSKHIALLK